MKKHLIKVFFSVSIFSYCFTAEKIPLYISADLTPQSRVALEKEVGKLCFSNKGLKKNEYLDHTTITYAPSKAIFDKYQKIAPAGDKMTIKPYKLCWSENFGVEAALVNLYNSKDKKIPSTNKYQHVTIATNGKPPVAGNYLFEKAEKGYNDQDKITDLKCKKLSNLSLDAISTYHYS
ncbi:hypothetical protein LO80_06225 [Candidatus Francisella endociliophora]|uniref:tRNA ligase phosphodiesterase domain-containing protein n=1 Tax=Candidatus Francisella endociliophora TaxID=653937 RepID=A0A097EPX7_9GAMM|nr:hypothetical protein [Francisella sp. FSC1006]AIT09596.1 hypothetical protein LO80_06225 [Francisella sp. FSC1006]